MSQVQVKSPFAEHCHEYIERDIPCLPVGPGTKVPGTCSFGEWRKMHGWDGYAERMPGETEIDIWCEWPGAGICVPMGGLSGLIAIDVDTNRPDIIAALETELAGLMVAKRRGQRGYAAFVLAGKDFKLSQSKWNVDGQRVLDLLHTGRQVVMPPTVHPDTNNPYVWLTPFKAYDRDQLPECPQDIVERCQRAIEPFQNSDDKRSQHEALVRAEHKIVAGDAEGRQINDAALARLSSWLEDLIPADMRERSGWGYRLKPFWRGVVDGFKVGVTPQGIRDFAAERGITPVDLVMEVKAVSAHKAMDWLAPLVGVPRDVVPDYDDIRKEFTGEYFNASAADVAAEQLEKARARAVVAMESRATSVPVKAVVDDGTVEMKPLTQPSLVLSEGMPNELLKPPGILADVFQWMLETAVSPLPEMCMQATIAFGSIMAGQIYTGPTNLRSNVHMIGIARSGFGKAHPQNCLDKLLRHCGQEDNIGGSRIASGPGLVAKLADTKTGGRVIYIIDEVDSVLSAALNERAPQHLRDIGTNMMELYSKSGGTYTSADHADRAKNKTVTIDFPHLTFIGFTTPDRFWSNVTAKDVKSGFVTRLLVCRGSDTRPKTNKNCGSIDEFPPGILLWKAAIRGVNYSAEHSSDGLPANSTAPIKVEFKDAASEAVMDNFVIETHELADRLNRTSKGMDETVTRWAENAYKLALIAAVAKYPQRPVIDVECVEWAVAYSRHCGRTVLAGIENEIYESPFDEAVQRVLQYIIKRGAAGTSARDLAKGCRKYKELTPTIAKQVMDRLVSAEQVELRQITCPNGRVTALWFAVDSTDADRSADN